MTSDRYPARVVPLLYLATAHVALGLACVLAGWWPQAVAGFFYHSWMVAIVHLVTLGWITFSILGAIYIVGPVALGMPMPARRGDYWAYACAIIGVIGMVAHFWIQEFGGMAWSAATVTLGILYVAWRIVRGVTRAHVQAAVKLHLVFACLNILVAASTGILLGFDKVYHFLPGFVLSNVFAHAHLAAIGWAAMMVVGVAYRLLPMTLPSRMPSGRSMFAGAILLETGVLGLFASLLLRSSGAIAAGLLVIAGVLVLAAHVAGMVRSPAARPPGAPRLDFAILHAAGAGASLLITVVLGFALLVMPASESSLRLAAAYGVFGLVGFLAQMVVAMEARLLPLATWYWAYAISGFQQPPPPPQVMRDRVLQAIVFIGWTAGVPALAAGLFLESAPLVATGAWSLFAAVTIATLDNVLVLLHMRRQHPQSDQTERNQVRKEEGRHRWRAAQDALEHGRAGLPGDGLRVEPGAEEPHQRLYQQHRRAKA